MSSNLIHHKLKLFEKDITFSPTFLKLLEKLRLRVPESPKKMRETNKFMQTVDFSFQIISSFKNFKKEINLLDCACGNSYLSFVLYYLLTEIYAKKVKIVGVDIQESLVENCNEISEELDFDGLEFHSADLNEYTPDEKMDGVYSLHACDIATDYAIAKTINLQAKSGFFASCCHNQISSQVEPRTFPNLTELFRNKPFKEKIGAFVTDTTRQLLLEGFNYRTRIFEFTPVRWTDKNIMLKCNKVGKPGITPKIAAYNKFVSKHHLKPILSEIFKTSLEIS
ncbi:MAG: class I SAM-dependent methyltransferase [Candidatus Hodarchaeales archaeon]|jgi:hypothetical protein